MTESHRKEYNHRISTHNNETSALAKRSKARALSALVEAQRDNEVLTGLLYINPQQKNFIELLNVVDEPLASLPLERVRPPREVLDQIMEELR